MGLRSWVFLQTDPIPGGTGPAPLGIIRCSHAAKHPRKVPAHPEMRLHGTAEDKTGISTDLKTSIRWDQVTFHEESNLLYMLNYSVNFIFPLSLLQVTLSAHTDKDSTWRNADWTLDMLLLRYFRLSSHADFILFYIYFVVHSYKEPQGLDQIFGAMLLQMVIK